MKYMIAMFGDQATMFEVRTPEWIRRMIEFMQNLDQELTDSGERVDSVGLADPSQAKTVRFQNGAPVPTDGPFAEARSRSPATGSWTWWTRRECSRSPRVSWPSSRGRSRCARSRTRPLRFDVCDRIARPR